MCVACSNILTAVDGDYGVEPTWREGVNSNAYYFGSVVAERGPAGIAFSDATVMFEDSYHENHDVWRQKRSTRTWLTVYANGGPDGGTLSLSSQNIGKLSAVEDGTLQLPSSLNLASNETFIRTDKFGHWVSRTRWPL